MTRTILTGVAVVVAAVSFLGTGCQSTGVGDPCTPDKEYDPAFAGFVEQEVSTEGESFQCQTRLCLVNHFQGRVTCPYGQNSVGGAPGDSSGGATPVVTGSRATAGCTTPGFPTPVTGPLQADNKTPVDMALGNTVQPQCTDRTAEKTVYCSCRCADINGTQNGGNFCNCPDGFTCTQLVSSLSASTDQGLTGAYCIKSGTQFGNTATGSGVAACTPCGTGGQTNCGNLNNTGGT
jgi:hypothetical protein